MNSTHAPQDMETGMVDLNALDVIDHCPVEMVLDPAVGWQACQSLLRTQQPLAIAFAKAGDGRELSLACRFRESGYLGQLHAVGALHEDMLYALKRSGFDYAHLPRRYGSVVNPVPGEGVSVGGRWMSVHEALRKLVDPFSAYYQSSVDGTTGLVCSGFGTVECRIGV